MTSSTDQPTDPRALDPYLALERLEHQERSVSARWERLYEYVASFPNAVLERDERAAHGERKKLREQIHALRAQLGLTGDEF